MYRFNISAPGKVSLFGDFITESETCVVASLNIRTRLSFASIFPRMIPKECIQLHFSRIHLEMKIPLNSFLRHFFYENFNHQCPAFEIYDQVKRYVQMLSGCSGNYDPRNVQHRLSLEAFFSLLVVIAYEQNINITSSFIVKISTDLPFACGLGSSLSFAVCLAACFFRWSQLQKGIVRYEFPHDELDLIGIYAGYCDEKIYNSMCPIDTSVIVNGGITVYEKNAVLTMYQHFPSIKILLVYSKVNKNIRKNKEIILAYWPGLKSIVDSINNLSWKSIDVFEQIKDIKGVNTSELDIIPESYYDELMELIHMNQGLLKMLNVPHGNVDIICAIAQEHFLYGKMTDSRGECILILLPPKIAGDQFKINKFVNQLVERDFHVVTTTLCGKWDGVGVVE